MRLKRATVPYITTTLGAFMRPVRVACGGELFRSVTMESLLVRFTCGKAWRLSLRETANYNILGIGEYAIWVVFGRMGHFQSGSAFILYIITVAGIICQNFVLVILCGQK